MNNDQKIKADVVEHLSFDPAVHAEHIAVSVVDGVVTLSGHVPTFEEKYAAEKLVFKVKGVRSVVDDVEVQLPPASYKADQDIARAAAIALEWNVAIPDDVVASVHDGVVTLRGQAEWDFQRQSAEESVRRIRGVVGINNLVTLLEKTSPTEAQVRTAIEKALMRTTEAEIRKLEIKVSGDTVTLKGKVRSHDESEGARLAAWSLPGIIKVENHLLIRQ